jgi:two-component system response regulator AtoC
MPETWKRSSREPLSYEGILTVAPEMRAFFTRLERAARSEASILIRGETGTGKELVARAIHRLSDRRGEFHALNCATLTGEMMASELFGHVKGAFTGAYRDRPGMFRLADKGTLFLDEVAEMPLDIQARTLRVLQEQRFIPLGGTDRVSVDVRIVSATHTALREAVEERRFREDLMYRIRVIPLYLPALAERTGDVEALTWAFLDKLAEQRPERKVAALASDARDALLDYAWPGNVRELQNAVEHAFVMGEGPVMHLEDLPPELLGEGPRVSRGGGRETGPEEDERARILRALRVTSGKRGDAAERLGMSRSTLWRKMREHHIEGPRDWRRA